MHEGSSGAASPGMHYFDDIFRADTDRQDPDDDQCGVDVVELFESLLASAGRLRSGDTASIWRQDFDQTRNPELPAFLGFLGAAGLARASALPEVSIADETSPDRTVALAGGTNLQGADGVWREYRLRGPGGAADYAIPLPDAKEFTIGRNGTDSDIVIPGEYVSRCHAKIEMRADGVYLHDLGSKNGTFILRGGREISVTGDSPVKLLPGDRIRLGMAGGPEVCWFKPGVAPQPFKPRGYQGEELRDGVEERVREARDPASSRRAREASNQYLRNHEFSGRFPDGFQVVGGFNQIDQRGRHQDTARPSYVIDRRPGMDPALESFIAQCQKDLAHLKDRPEKLAEEIAKRAKAAMEPQGWSEWQVDQGYLKLRKDNAGGRMLLGDFITAAARGEGAGVCNHQSALLKVTFDSFYPDDATRPKMKIVRGHLGGDPSRLAPQDAMNHCWCTLEVKGKENVFDPRGEIYGAKKEACRWLHPGRDIPQLRPPPEPVLLSESPQRFHLDGLPGKEVNFEGRKWTVRAIEDGKVVIFAGGMRDDVSKQELFELNTREDGRLKPIKIGEQYRIRRSDGRVEDGWTLVGFKDPQKRDTFVFVKADAYVKTVTAAELQPGNEQTLGELPRKVGEMNGGAEHVVVAPGAAGDPVVRNLDTTFNPERPDGYVELRFTDRAGEIRYFMDLKTQEVFIYSEVTVTDSVKLKTMTRTYELLVLPKLQAEARVAGRPAEPAVPRELALASRGGHGAPGIEVLEIDAESGRLRKAKMGGAGEIARIGELNERTIENLIRGWERDLQLELDKIKNDPSRRAQYEELSAHKAALERVRVELAAGGERARAVVDYYREALKPGAEVGRHPEHVSRWNGRVAVGAGIVISIGILVATALAYHNRFMAEKQPKPPERPSLPPLSR